ncbi:MAG: hypothetical protein ACSLFC_13940 [Desulfuromonadales bacterium]
MKYHRLITHKRYRKNADKSQKTQAVHVNEHWLDEDTDEQHNTGPRLNSSALHALSRKGLWGLLLFLLVSVAAFMVQDFNLYQTFPEPVLQILGCPPPAILIHLALTAYSFTVVVPVLIRMATGENPMVSWHHLLCRSVFYLFYLVSTTLPENFIAVIIIGLLLYAIEQAGIWSYMYKNLHEAKVSG